MNYDTFRDVIKNDNTVFDLGFNLQQMPSKTLMDFNSTNDIDGIYSGIVYDTDSREIMYVEICSPDYHYYWTHPDFVNELSTDACKLEVLSDMFEKFDGIMNNKPFDERVEVIIELEDDILMALFHLAHEKDITFNQLVEETLIEFIDNFNK